MNELINEKDNYEPHKRVVVKLSENNYQSMLVSDISFALEQWQNRIEELNKVREWATKLQEVKPQNGFMDMNGAGNYLLYLIGDIEKPNEVTPELKVQASRKLWKILEGGQ